MGKRSKQKKVKKDTKVESQAVSRVHSQYFYWVILILVVLFTGFIRLRLLSIPLERDEGEFAYMGQLILQGIPPYLISYNMKLPGIYAAYAFIMFVFGQTVKGIHLGFLLINGATTILVFLLVKRLYDSYTAIIASASFAILSVSPTVLGTSAHASHFVLLPALGGILLLLKAIDSNKLKHVFWSGILLGLSVMMKQPGIFFGFFALLYFLFNQLRLQKTPFRLFVKRASLFLLGAIIPFVLTCVILYRAGVIEKFWFWTFSYASEYASQIPFSKGMELFSIQFAKVMGNFNLLWGIAGAGIIALFWDKTSRTHATFILGFSVFSFLAVCPGLYFRPHYFVFFLGAVALLIGIAISSFKRLILRLRPTFQFLSTILFLAVCSVGAVQYGTFFFNLTPDQACSAMYSGNPFPQSVEIARYIESHTEKEDKIAVLGSEPQICFYAKRHSATGYIYAYPLMEDQKYAFGMQKEMTEEIERAQPKYLVFVNVVTSWLVRRNSVTYIFDWYKEYTQNNFDLVGVIDILSRTQTVYRWDNEAANYSPQSPYFLAVYRRKASVVVH
jgi:hypothetical protein